MDFEDRVEEIEALRLEHSALYTASHIDAFKPHDSFPRATEWNHLETREIFSRNHDMRSLQGTKQGRVSTENGCIDQRVQSQLQDIVASTESCARSRVEDQEGKHPKNKYTLSIDGKSRLKAGDTSVHGSREDEIWNRSSDQSVSSSIRNPVPTTADSNITKTNKQLYPFKSDEVTCDAFIPQEGQLQDKIQIKTDPDQEDCQLHSFQENQQISSRVLLTKKEVLPDIPPRSISHGRAEPQNSSIGSSLSLEESSRPSSHTGISRVSSAKYSTRSSSAGTQMKQRHPLCKSTRKVTSIRLEPLEHSSSAS